LNDATPVGASLLAIGTRAKLDREHGPPVGELACDLES